MLNRIRISCGGLCRIVNAYGDWLLGINLNNLRNGDRVLKPIGGALRYYPHNLLARWQAEPETVGEQELRFYMDEAYLPDFKRWFQSAQEREVTPLRELSEELVDEYRVLPPFTSADIRWRYLHTVERVRHTERNGAAGHTTLNLHDIYEVRFTRPDLLDRLYMPLADALYWVTPKMIRHGQTQNGIPIQADVLL